MELIKELTFEDRSTWGDCSVCKAVHGEACDSNVGISLGLNAYGKRPIDGAHLARLQAAPYKIKIVPC